MPGGWGWGWGRCLPARLPGLVQPPCFYTVWWPPPSPTGPPAPCTYALIPLPSPRAHAPRPPARHDGTQIRTQIAKEWAQDLSAIGEENAALLRETLSFSLSLDNVAEHPLEEGGSGGGGSGAGPSDDDGGQDESAQ